MNLNTYMEMSPRAKITLVAFHLLDVAREEGWISGDNFATKEGSEVAKFAMFNGDRPRKTHLLQVTEYLLDCGRLVGASADDFVSLMMAAMERRYPT